MIFRRGARVTWKVQKRYRGAVLINPKREHRGKDHCCSTTDSSNCLGVQSTKEAKRLTPANLSRVKPNDRSDSLRNVPTNLTRTMNHHEESATMNDGVDTRITFTVVAWVITVEAWTQRTNRYKQKRHAQESVWNRKSWYTVSAPITQWIHVFDNSRKGNHLPTWRVLDLGCVTSLCLRCATHAQKRTQK